MKNNNNYINFYIILWLLDCISLSSSLFFSRKLWKVHWYCIDLFFPLYIIKLLKNCLNKNNPNIFFTLIMIHLLVWSISAYNTPSLIALATINSTSVFFVNYNFWAISANEILEYDRLIFLRPVLITI